MDAETRGTALVLAGIGLFLVTLLASAALAPSVGADPGDARKTVVGIQGGGPGWHQYGSVQYYRGSDLAWQETSADSYFDVTRLDDGSYLVGFMHGGYDDCGPYEASCSRTGYRVLETEPEPSVVAEWSFPVRTKKNSEVHAASRLPSGEFLVTDMDRERIFTVRDGSITWQWNASELYEPPADPTTRDWLHLNDVDVIGEDRYLVSIRNANQLVMVERGEGAVEIINADRDDGDDGSCRRPGQLVDADGDGDVRCGDPSILDHQHNPQWLGDGAVLVADSDNDRIVELHRSDDGEWEPAWALSKAGDITFNWPRDADRLPNGNVLITDTLNRRVVEVDREGDVVWAIETRHIPYEADRLPHGELVGAPTADGGNETPINEGSGDIPVLSTLLVGLRAVAPGVPFWFSELQLLLSLTSLGLVIAGAVTRHRAPGTSDE